MTEINDANLAAGLPIQWNEAGLVAAIVQDASTNEVLMMAWMNAEALALTIGAGETHFYSRSRGRLWRKGETSGHIQRVESIRIDCDGDVLLVRVSQVGGACHEGYRSCFFRELEPDGSVAVRAERVFDPNRSYGG